MPDETQIAPMTEETQRTDGGTDAQSVQGDYTGPGETQDGNLPDDVVSALTSVCQKMVQREKMARLQQVARVHKARMFSRGLQYLSRNDENGLYIQDALVATPGWKKYDPASNQNPQLVINIYQAYENIHVTNFSVAPCGTRFEPNNPDVTSQIDASKEAEAMRKIICKINDQKDLQAEVASLSWTDGTVVFYSRNVEDGSKFGIGEDGKPRQYPEIEAEGLLEWKIPIAATSFDDWDYACNQREIPLTVAKAAYKTKRDKITADSLGGLGGDPDLSRQARMSVMEGLSLDKNASSRYQSGDGAAVNVTRSRFHLRVSAFEEASEEQREKLLEYFPTGALVKFIGNTYVESKDEDMADHIVPYRPRKGKGFNVPGIGNVLIDPQEWVNNLANNAKDCFDNTTPSKYYNSNVLKPETLANQTNQYGNWIPVELKDGDEIGRHFYQDQEVHVPSEILTVSEKLQGSLSQFLTGLQPAMFGGEMGAAGETAQGYAQAMAQAKAMMVLSWAPFKTAWAQVMRQCVKIAATAYGAGTILKTYVTGAVNKRELVVVHVDNLKGDFLASPDTDESYPESTGAKKAVLAELRNDASKDPELAALLNYPSNARLQMDVAGLDLDDPRIESWDKQLREIEEMQDQPTLPDPQAVQKLQEAEAQGVQVPPQMVQSIPRVSSISISKFDDDETELLACVRWLNSSVGQDAKRNNPSWYQNVELHAGEHQDRMKQNAPAPEGKPPSESINFKDLPPDGQMQLAAKAGLKIQPPPSPIVAPQMGAQPTGA